MNANTQQLTTTIETAVTESAGKFVETLSQYQWDLVPDAQLQAAKMALTKSDYIMKIAAQDTEAVKNAVVQSAILGLDLTEGKRQGWLIPRKNQKGNTVIQLQVGYKGVEAIHQRMGVIDRLVIRVVHEHDEFDWSGDDQEKPVHKADWFDEKKRGPITGVYAITYYPDKTINVVTAPVTEIFEKHRDGSDAYKNYVAKTEKGEWCYEPPWVSHEKAMIEKTMAYIAAKQWPANIRDNERSSKILETLHETDVADYSYGYTLEQKEAFYNFIENNDALGMYLFSKNVGIEVYSAITYGQSKAVPRGEKTKARQAQDDFKNSGHDIFHEVMRAIAERDVGLLAESTEGIMVMTEKLLMRELNDGDKAEYKSMCEDMDAIEAEAVE